MYWVRSVDLNYGLGRIMEMENQYSKLKSQNFGRRTRCSRMSAKSRIKIMNISNTTRSSFVVLDFYINAASNGPTLRSILDLTSYYRFNELTKLVYTKESVRGFYLRKEKKRNFLKKKFEILLSERRKL